MSKVRNFEFPGLLKLILFSCPAWQLCRNTTALPSRHVINHKCTTGKKLGDLLDMSLFLYQETMIQEKSLLGLRLLLWLAPSVLSKFLNNCSRAAQCKLSQIIIPVNGSFVQTNTGAPHYSFLPRAPGHRPPRPPPRPRGLARGRQNISIY